MRWIFSFVALAFIALALPLYSFNEKEQQTGPVHVEMFCENISVKPLEPFWVALHFKLDPSWHIYWKNPGDSGAPITVIFDMPNGFKVDEIKWPTPHSFELEGFVGIGYEDEVTLLVKIVPDEKIKDIQSFPIKAIMQWVACSNECIPQSVSLEKEFKVSMTDSQRDTSSSPLFEKARNSLPLTSSDIKVALKDNHINFSLSVDGNIKEMVFYPEDVGLVDLSVKPALLKEGNKLNLMVPLTNQLTEDHIKGVLVGKFEGLQKNLSFEVNTPIQKEDTSLVAIFLIAVLAAFTGGALLNLMPCVLPVLSLKVLSVVQAADECKKERFQQGFAYVIGVTISFWVLTAILLIVRASGSELGWGFQLQEPLFVGMLTLLMFLMALNFFGVFEMGSSLISLDNPKKSSSKLFGSFFSGVIATIVATPCTGPFLGAALGFAMTLPWYGTFCLFTVMALGMALPFFILTIYPKLLKFLPKPGNWMLLLKQVFGFILLFTALWLIWVFEAQTSFTSVMWLLISLVVLSIAAWLYGHFGGFNVRKTTRNIMRGVSALILVSSVSIVAIKSNILHAGVKIQDAQSSWEPFSTKRLEELRQSGKPVFIDFTAKWCLLCQANKAVLHSKEVDEAFEKAGIVKLDADWTRGDPEITKLLKEFGRTGVPLYVLYSSDAEGKPKIFAETLTQEMLVEATSNLAQANVY
jgi:thiol:disulfide interchange protein